RFDLVDNFVHQRLWFADGKSANRITWKVHSNQSFGALFSKVRVDASLNDTKQLLGRSVLWAARYRACASRIAGLLIERPYSLKMPATPLGPGKRPFHGAVCVEMAGRIGKAVVQNHHDVRTKRGLNVDRKFRTQEVGAAVEVRLEANAIVI